MDKDQGFLLIGTSMIILMVLAISVFAVMLIYRKRKLEYEKEKVFTTEQHAKELLAARLEIQQQTMQHIGREIHDNVGQQLTLASLYAQRLDTEISDEAVQKKISAIAGIINASLNDLRSLSKNLTDTSMAGKNLSHLIAAECVKVQAAASCKINFNTNTENEQTSDTVKNFVLRIVQEFLQNSLKHSGCTVININLKKEEAGLYIFGEDNGKGFIQNNTAGGIGLQNMKKRAELLGGDLIIKSALEKGTTMQLFIAYNKL